MIQWLTENWEAIFAIVLSAQRVALLIVNMTPTPKDNEILGTVYKVIEVIAGIFGKKAKEQ